MALDFGIGDIISSGINMYSANATAQKNIDWEKEKAQNYHQWEMEDYRKAGINPILTTGGHPTVGGANAQMPDTSGLGRAFEKSLTAKKIQNETNVANADVEMKKEQTKNIGIDTILKSAQTGAISVNTANALIEKELKEKELKWYDWKAGVGIGKDVAVGIGGLGLGIGNIKNAFKKPNPPINKTTEKYISNMYNNYIYKRR